MINIANPHIYKDYRKISFSPEQEEAICRTVSSDVVARLELVKTCMDLVVKFANWYALESGMPFSKLIQIGVITVVKSAERYGGSEKTNFVDYLSQELLKAMMDLNSKGQ